MNEVNESKILWDNCKYNGIDITKFYEYCGEAIAKKLISKFGATKHFSVVCGLGGNGTDGLAIADALASKTKHLVKVYLVGRSNHIDNPVGSLLWEKIRKNKNIEAKQECYAKDLKQADVILESLVGTGLDGKVLNKRFRDIVRKMAHLDAKIIAIDIAVPHYKPDFTFSILYPKDENAEVIAFDLPAEITTFCGPGEYSALWKPHTKTHKTKNGKVLYITDNKDHLELVNKAMQDYATTFTYFLLEGPNSSMINVNNLEKEIENSDTILLGNIKQNYLSKSFLKNLFQDFKDKTFIVFGDNIEKSYLKDLKNITIILNRLQLKKLIDKPLQSTALEGSLRRFCIENKLNAILLGSKTLLYNSSGNFRFGYLKNVFEDNIDLKLASVVAAYQAKNDPWLSMRAGVFTL